MAPARRARSVAKASSSAQALVMAGPMLDGGVVLGPLRLRRRLLLLRPEVAALDEADLAARLEDGPLHVAHVRDPRQPHLRLDLVPRQAVATQVPGQQLPVPNDDPRLALQKPLRP